MVTVSVCVQCHCVCVCVCVVRRGLCVGESCVTNVCVCAVCRCVCVTYLVRAAWFLPEPLLSNRMPLCELELAFSDVQPCGLFLKVREHKEQVIYQPSYCMHMHFSVFNTSLIILTNRVRYIN